MIPPTHYYYSLQTLHSFLQFFGFPDFAGKFISMEPNPASDHILDWFEGSVSYYPSFLDDPYNPGGIQDYNLWGEGQDVGQVYQVGAGPGSPNVATVTTGSAAIRGGKTPAEPYVSNNNPPSSDLPNKRKASDDLCIKPSQNHHKSKKSKSRAAANEADNGEAVVEGTTTVKKSAGNKNRSGKANGNNCNNGNNKEGRWAEQLLNPCALALATGNMTRVQHLLYVIHELASLSGDANHRLAAHGLRALTQQLSSSSSSFSSSTASSGSSTFASADPRFFQKSLLKFYEVSPWFAFPNNIANSSIMQILSEESNNSETLHIIDIGVSHGFQWPTFLEALTRRPGGPPPLVRLTVVTAPAENDQNMETPFAIGPPGDNFSSRLLGFAKSMNINLQINRLDNHPLQNLNTQILDVSPDETFIVCAQFRLHHLNHNNTPDERSEFLKILCNMKPKGVILSENNMDCCCNSCGNFAIGFERRVEFLWKFLDSISSAFKGRESEERRLMEGEAAKALTNQLEMTEGKEKWCDRMREAGFIGEKFSEDAIDGGRALLRKYDNNWEMRIEENHTSVGLWWKGQPVSFCTLWKLNKNDIGELTSRL